MTPTAIPPPSAQTLGYDQADRHATTAVAGGPTVAYTRDAANRVIARSEPVANGTTTTVLHYGYAGPTDSLAFTMDDANNVAERTVGLVGGVTLTKAPTPPQPGMPGADVWSYPNIHGDVMATAGPTGVKNRLTLRYDPFGQALDGLPNNSAGNSDYGWLGSKTRRTRLASAWDLYRAISVRKSSQRGTASLRAIVVATIILYILMITKSTTIEPRPVDYIVTTCLFVMFWGGLIIFGFRKRR